MKKFTDTSFSPLLGMVGLMIGAVLMQGCMDDDESDLEKQRKIDDQLVAEYLTNNNIDAERSSIGFYYTKISANDAGEKVENNDIVSITYEMSLLSGKTIGSVSDDLGTPVKFLYRSDGNRLAPAAVSYAAGLMRQGETFRLYIPAYLAFGSYAYKSLLPANANLIVDMQIAQIDGKSTQLALERTAIEAYIAEKVLENVVDFSSGLHYKKLVEGTGNKPRNGSRVTVSYEGTYLDDTVFDKSEEGRPISFTIGNGTVITGFEDGIKLMEEGEEAILIIPSELAYGGNVEVIPGVLREDFLTRQAISNQTPPFSTLVFQLKLENVQ